MIDKLIKAPFDLAGGVVDGARDFLGAASRNPVGNLMLNLGATAFGLPFGVGGFVGGMVGSRPKIPMGGTPWWMAAQSPSQSGMPDMPSMPSMPGGRPQWDIGEYVPSSYRG